MITSFYAGLLGLLYFFISLETIKARRSQKVSLGAGPKDEIIHLVSAHNNFANYTPLFLLLFFFIDSASYPLYLLHFLGICFLTGRVLHFLTMKNKETTFKKRKLAMQFTLWPIIFLSLWNIYDFLINLILV